MIIIPVSIIDGKLTPETDPTKVPGAVRIEMHGTECVVYQHGDALPQPDAAALLAVAKSTALALLTEKRLEEEYAGPVIMVDGKPVRFPSTVKDETRLNSLAGLFAVDPATVIEDWKVAQGVYVTMTAPLLMQIKTAGFTHIATTFSVERAKAAEIEACPTPEAVQAWLDLHLNKGWST